MLTSIMDSQALGFGASLLQALDIGNRSQDLLLYTVDTLRAQKTQMSSYWVHGVSWGPLNRIQKRYALKRKR